ncbi:4-hydroxy-tetrahydrodipicolinate synthase [Botrimarina colliarenosi]|uniref:4-hydroxy-tetrahydrodipicolinate synthase n=1 Tax=Botrimarina colliarenosi TaxID=2528001 RepID=A0A5C6AAN3_9BACT|nr:4-hydroxy-tetrahydrodipicolinate synthase [Botrimarina colliarenosi]TWT96619.1 4-hydroxy-tetrahydrodipicolinate synthase [Botrimarina colliarenosi]
MNTVPPSAMITPDQLRGAHVALVTPMKPVGSLMGIDFERVYQLIDTVLEAGVSGVLFAGTTGQSAMLSHDEQVDLCTRGIEYARGRAADLGRPVTCLASAGSNSTDEALHLTERITKAIRPDALLHVTGYYNNPPQEGLRAHFEAVGDLAERLDTSIILYNIPGRTGSRIEAETMIRLAEHPAIAAVKDATGDLKSLEVIRAATDPAEFSLLSGEDHLVVDVMQRGGVGVISASANRWPREFQRITELAAAGDWDAAIELQKALQPCIDAVFCVKNPIPLHHMLKTGLRMPMMTVGQLDPANRDRAIAKIEAAEAIVEFPHVEAAAV